MDLSNFDLFEYLNDQNISYTTTGKNVSQGWIGVSCPFCGDPTNHLGINIEAKTISCFRCGEKGNILKYIMEIEDISFKEAISKINKYGTNILIKTKQGDKQKAQKISEDFEPLQMWHKEYLAGRKFDPDKLEKKYKLKSARITSSFAHRIIIPFYFNNKMITFTTRDVTGKSELKYQHCPITRSVIPPKETLFNIDNAKKNCIVCEGCMDVFRLGDGCVALNGVNYTRQQLLLLSAFKRIFILFDPEEKAQQQARNLALALSSCVSNVEVINLGINRDPGDLTDQEAKELKNELIGRRC